MGQPTQEAQQLAVEILNELGIDVVDQHRIVFKIHHDEDDYPDCVHCEVPVVPYRALTLFQPSLRLVGLAQRWQRLRASERGL